VIKDQPHRAGPHLRRELVRCLAHDGSTFSGVGASGKPGAVQDATLEASLDGTRYGEVKCECSCDGKNHGRGAFKCEAE
jgi:hypothetical protein